MCSARWIVLFNSCFFVQPCQEVQTQKAIDRDFFQHNSNNEQIENILYTVEHLRTYRCKKL